MRRVIACLLIAVMLVGLCACGLQQMRVVGTWKHKSSVLGVATETTYVFESDGTGKKTNVLDIPFTYSVSDGKLRITTSVLGIETTEEYSLSFDGSKMVMTGKNETLVLEKAD